MAWQRSIELGKLAAGDLLQTGLVGLLSLLPLTKYGAGREVVEEMISGLVSAEKTESLWIGYTLASRVLKDDLNWLSSICRIPPVLKINTEMLPPVQVAGLQPATICLLSPLRAD